MSQITDASPVEELDDSIFENYQKTVKENAERKSNRSSFAPRSYDDLAYVGTVTGKNIIIRLIGAPPGSEKQGYVRRDYDPIKFISTEVKDQEGKKFRIRLPLHSDISAKDHIVHRLYNKIKEVNWIPDPADPSGKKNKKVFVNQNKYPELFDQADHLGYDAVKDPMGWKCCKGLKGQEVIAFNVIDRQDSWCADNKHTKLLCKNVSQSGEAIFADDGIASFGFEEMLAKQIAKYGNYERYDIAIKRTGQTSPAYEIANASQLKSKDNLIDIQNDNGTEVDADIIIVGPLTPEEKTYERYNLTKLKGVTSYQKIEKKIGWFFKLTDAQMGTKFYNELEGLVADEKIRFKEMYAANAEAEEKLLESKEQEIIKETIKESKIASRTRQTVGEVSGLSKEKIAALKGWSKLTPEQHDLIEDVVLGKEGEVTSIIYKDKDANLLACDCGIASPEQLQSCPACAADFV